VQSHNVLVTAGVYAVRFLGVALFAVVVPPANVTCIVPPPQPPSSSLPQWPEFIACELALRAPFAPLFPLPVPRPDVRLPVAAVLFAASDNATDQCRAATALLSAVNARFDPARDVPLLDERTRAVVDAMLLARGMMMTASAALGRCTGAARRGALLRADRPLLAAAVATGTVAADAPAQPWCSAVHKTPGPPRTDGALDSRGGGGGAQRRRLDAGMGEEVAWTQGGLSCRLVCTVVGAFVPAQGESDDACARAAAASLELVPPGARAFQPLWWPEERLHAARGCDDVAEPRRTAAADDVSVGELEFPFVVVATRLRGASAMQRAAALTKVEAWTREHVHVVRLDLDADDVAGVYHVAGIAVSVTRSGDGVVLATTPLGHRIEVDVAERGGAVLFTPERPQSRGRQAGLVVAACSLVALGLVRGRMPVKNKVKV